MLQWLTTDEENHLLLRMSSGLSFWALNFIDHVYQTLLDISKYSIWVTWFGFGKHALGLSLQQLRYVYVPQTIEKVSSWASCCTKNKMDATVGTNDIADTSDIQGIGCLLKCLLHLPRSKPAKVTTITVRRTIRMLRCQLCENSSPVGSLVNLRLVILQYFDGFFLSASNVCLPRDIQKGKGQSRADVLDSNKKYLLPARWASALLVFY